MSGSANCPECHQLPRLYVLAGEAWGACDVCQLKWNHGPTAMTEDDAAHALRSGLDIWAYQQIEPPGPLNA